MLVAVEVQEKALPSQMGWARGAAGLGKTCMCASITIVKQFSQPSLSVRASMEWDSQDGESVDTAGMSVPQLPTDCISLLLTKIIIHLTDGTPLSSTVHLHSALGDVTAIHQSYIKSVREVCGSIKG